MTSKQCPKCGAGIEVADNVIGATLTEKIELIILTKDEFDEIISRVICEVMDRATAPIFLLQKTVEEVRQSAPSSGDGETYVTLKAIRNLKPRRKTAAPRKSRI